MYLEIRNLTLLYDTAMVLNEVNLEIDSGELVSIVGPNGAGKSTLLRAIAGLVKWEKDTLRGTALGKITIRGKVIFNGEEMTKLPAYEITKEVNHLPRKGKAVS